MGGSYTTPFGGSGAVFDEPADFTPAEGEGYCVKTYKLHIETTRQLFPSGCKQFVIRKYDYEYQENCVEDEPELVSEAQIKIRCKDNDSDTTSQIDCELVKDLVEKAKIDKQTLGAALSIIKSLSDNSPEFKEMADKACSGPCGCEASNFTTQDAPIGDDIQIASEPMFTIDIECSLMAGTCNALQTDGYACNDSKSGRIFRNLLESDFPKLAGTVNGYHRSYGTPSFGNVFENWSHLLINPLSFITQYTDPILAKKLLCAAAKGCVFELPLNEDEEGQSGVDYNLDEILDDCLPITTNQMKLMNEMLECTVEELNDILDNFFEDCNRR